MATLNTTNAPINDTDANFRLWCSMIYDFLTTTAGFVDNGDTGQVDLATVTRPTTTNTDQGYKVLKSNDLTNKWVVRLDFGSGAVTNNPRLGVTFGWSTNGAGVVATNALARQNLTLSSSASLRACYLAGSGTEGWMALHLWCETSHLALSIERTIDSAGAEEDQCFVYGFGSNGGVLNDVAPRTGTLPTRRTTIIGGWLEVGSAEADYNGDKGVGALFPVKGRLLKPSINNFLGNTTHFSTGGTNYPMTVRGVTRTYRSASVTNSPVNGHRLLMRYE